jgi:hypothetical protein
LNAKRLILQRYTEGGIRNKLIESVEWIGYIVNCAGAGAEQTPLLCAIFLRKRSFATTGAGPPQEKTPCI